MCLFAFFSLSSSSWSCSLSVCVWVSFHFICLRYYTVHYERFRLFSYNLTRSCVAFSVFTTVLYCLHTHGTDAHKQTAFGHCVALRCLIPMLVKIQYSKQKPKWEMKSTHKKWNQQRKKQRKIISNFGNLFSLSQWTFQALIFCRWLHWPHTIYGGFFLPKFDF